MKTGLLSLLFCLIFLSGNLSAQLQCGTDHKISEYYQAHPEQYAAFVKNELLLNNSPVFQKSTEDTMLYIIPVVFHVLHLNGPENISDAQIIDGINILNRDMKKLNADTSLIIPEFRHLASKLRVEFRLATIDPDGNCTNGIDRIYTSKTNYGDDSAKLNPWPRNRYLNIWTAKALLQGWAGYAYYPSAADGPMEVHDGIMVLASYIGSIGTSDENKSRTLTHEVGHWLDLGHPWNTTINISINVGLACGDDLVPDTPVTKGHTTCPSNLRTPDCTIEGIGENYLTFSGVTTASGTTDNTALPASLSHFNPEPFEAVGLSANSATAGAFSFTDWDAGAANGETVYSNLPGSLNTAKYYEFVIIPDTGYTSTLSEISFKVKRSANGPRTFAVKSSASSFSTNMVLETETGSGISSQTGNILFFENDIAGSEYTNITVPLSGAFYNNMYLPFTMRFYAWNSESAAGEFTVDSVSLSGTTGVIENIQNYMEYSYCTYMWTKGQCQRMLAALNSPLSGRNNMWTESNLISTGVLNPGPLCVPQADFYASANRICEGKTVTFTMNETNADATSQSWTFTGGSPATSTLPSPLVIYPTAGLYPVSLTTTNSAGSTTETKQGFILVDDGTAINAENNFYETFEVSADFNQNWKVTNTDNNTNTWVYITGNGVNNSNAVCINGDDAFYMETDELVSPYYNLSGTSTNLNFKLAGCSKNETGNGDKMIVFFKKNCESNWTFIKTFSSIDLNNNPFQTAVFIPGSGTVWENKTVNIGPTYRTDEFQFKFVYYSDFSTNRIYIDDINIGGPLGVDENQNDELGLAVYPVPSNGTFKVSYELPASAITQLSVFDISGKKIFVSKEQLSDSGKQEENLSISAGKGVYFIVLSVDGRNYTMKQIIE